VAGGVYVFALDFGFLFKPVEELDAALSGLLSGAPLLVALGIAFILGLRHASDPDHLVAVTSLVAADDGDTSGAVKLGAAWGLGHAAALLALGAPLIALRSEPPRWLEAAAEKAIGIVIVVLAARVVFKWIRGDFRAAAHGHDPLTHGDPPGHRHLRRGAAPTHPHGTLRTARQAAALGLLHGLAGTGAVIVLLLAALPSRLEAALALAVFAPMSVLSMTCFTAAFAWVLTRPTIDRAYRTAVIPAFGLFGVSFGLWYAGLA
jgi:ABC-type nickel/cobalt efflux system permease component RcnA